MPTKPDLAVIHEVPTGRLIPHPENARRGDVPAIARSLAALGQYRPLVVSWRTMRVCAGNHTLAAAISLGWDTIKVGYVTATPTEERRILLADNRLPELGHYDDPALAGILEALTSGSAGADALVGTGFDVLDLEQIVGTLIVPDFKPTPANDARRLDQLDHDTCPTCGSKVARGSLI